jgi:uncharacterized membrane protein
MNTLYFSLVILALGIILIIANFNIDNSMKNCVDDKLRNSNKGILVLAVTAIVFAISNITYSWKCDCTNSSSLAIEIYTGFIFILGVTLLSLGVTIQDKAKQSLECKNAGEHAKIVTFSGTFMTIIAGLYLIFVIYMKYKDNMPKMISNFGG